MLFYSGFIIVCELYIMEHFESTLYSSIMIYLNKRKLKKFGTLKIKVMLEFAYYSKTETQHITKKVSPACLPSYAVCQRANIH